MIEDPFNAPSQSNQHWPRRIAKLDRTPKTHKIVSPIGEALLDKKRSVRDAARGTPLTLDFSSVRTVITLVQRGPVGTTRTQS